MAQNRYVFAQRDVDDFSCIKIVEGNYKDVIYTYGKVQFASEENAQGEMPLKFTYDVKENPLEWLDTMLNAVEHMNFFEGRATTIFTKLRGVLTDYI